MEPLAAAVASIIKEQMAIIGPIAIDQAKKVPGLKLEALNDIQIEGDKKAVLDRLITTYEKLFGQASVQVCKDAFSPYRNQIPADQVPEILIS